ncbi:hypothetical protein MNAN1_000997 [Malassezia nana]|uniref:Uncharacterized protein n=1 Tax=Malassezia nana TaxID=180528 RepID=A0AAF0EGI5_9BASI|nr:hypothetical protein MNAN1_000997 [Malassezia nana]
MSSHWTYWRIYPDPVIATLTDVQRHASIPDVSEDPKPNPVHHSRDPLPQEATSMLRIAMRWTCRLHAHTPIASWNDMHVADGARQWFPGTAVHIQAMGIAYSAPSSLPPDFELRVYCAYQVDHVVQHEYVLVRIDRARQMVTVQHDHARVSQRRRTIQTVELARIQALTGLEAFDRWVLHQALRMHTCADTLLAELGTHSSARELPPPLTPTRRKELAAREKAWYMRARAPGLGPLGSQSTACRKAAKQPRS